MRQPYGLKVAKVCFNINFFFMLNVYKLRVFRIIICENLYILFCIKDKVIVVGGVFLFVKF